MNKVVVAVPALGAGLALMMTDGVVESTGTSRARVPAPIARVPIASRTISDQRAVILRDPSGAVMTCKRLGAWYVCGSRVDAVEDPGDRGPR
jgi:hypothetical protein